MFRILVMLSCTVQLAADIIMQINVLVSETACILVPLKCTVHNYSRAVLCLLNLLTPRQSCSGILGSSATSFVQTPMRIIHVPSMPASMTCRRSGDDLVVALVKHGYAPSRTTSNIRTWDCGQPGTELMTVICGVISWKRRRCGRGMLHDDDDDDEYCVCLQHG